MKRFVHTLFMITTVAIATGCIVSETPIEPDKPKPGSKNVDVLLRLRTPGSYSAGRYTRGLNLDDENRITDIHVLVFGDDVSNGGGTLTSIKVGEDVTAGAVTGTAGISGEGSFTVTLTASEDGEQSKLVVLANLDALPGMTGESGRLFTLVGRTYAQVIQALSVDIDGPLYTSAPAPGKFHTVPMWGETELFTISPAGGNTLSISLTRAVARIDVGLGTPNDDGTAWDGLDPATGTAIPFRLTKIYIARSSSRFAVIPDGAKLSSGKPTVILAGGETLADASFPLQHSFASFVYTVSNPLHTTRDIYIPEADVRYTSSGKAGDGNHTDRMAIVVGGNYDNGPESFYRLDFNREEGLIDVLRNRLYQFNISKVTGPGYSTPEIAYASASMNMDVKILDWDEDPFEEIIARGSNHFALSKSSPATLSPLGGETETFTFETNLDTFTMTLDGTSTTLTSAAAAVGAGSTTTTEWFTYTLLKDSSVPGLYTLTVTTRTGNFGGAEPVLTRNDRWKVNAAGVISFDYLFDQPWSAIDPTPYDVSIVVTPAQSGTVVATHSSAKATTPVTVVATPAESYTFTGWTVTTAPASFTSPTPEQLLLPELRFTMPAGAVKFTATFVASTDLTVRPSALTFEGTDAGTSAASEITIDSTFPWTAAIPGDSGFTITTDPSATIGTTSASGPKGTGLTLRVIPTANPTVARRTATLTIKSDNGHTELTREVVVVQSGVAIRMSADRLSLTFVESENYPGRGQRVTVSSNAPWEVPVTSVGFTITSVDPGTGTLPGNPTPGQGAWDGSFVVYPTTRNTGTTDRTSTLMITPTGGGTSIPVSLRQLRPVGGYGDLLYIVGENENARLEVGQWGDEITSTAQMAFFKFGGVVALNQPSSNDTWSTDDVKFNPTTYTISNYTSGTALSSESMTLSLRNVPGYSSTDGIAGWDPVKGANESKLVSSPEYHNVTNLLVGKGDPCQLVGLTVAQIRAALASGELPVGTGGWRTPTYVENEKFYGSSSNNGADSFWTAGESSPTNPGTRTFNDPRGTASGSVLPASGSRDGYTGGVTQFGQGGIIWSSTPGDSGAGFQMYFIYNSVFISRLKQYYSFSHPVRCTSETATPPLGQKLEVTSSTGFAFDSGGDVKTLKVSAPDKWSATLTGSDAFTFMDGATTRTSWPDRPAGRDIDLSVIVSSQAPYTNPRTATLTLTSTSGTLSLTRTITLTQSTGPNNFTTPPSEVRVGDLFWASTNLNNRHDVKSFATKPSDYGALFQFGNPTPYAYVGGTTPPASYTYSTDWQMGDVWEFNHADNPCPVGWRLPTEAEFTALVNAATNSGDGNALVAAPGTTTLIRRMQFADGAVLFFPAGGYRTPDGSYGHGIAGRYWTGSYSGGYGRSFDFSGSVFGGADMRVQNTAQSVRCVRPVPPTPEAVTIGSTTWAPTNLDAENSFAPYTSDYGALFQYGRPKAYSYSGGSSLPSDEYRGSHWPMGEAPDWAAPENPCPTGWRLPIEIEYKNLLDAATNRGDGNDMVMFHGSNPGRRFDFAGGKSLFFPAAGRRASGSSSNGNSRGTDGYYRSGTGTWNGGIFMFYSSEFGRTQSGENAYGYTVRCVQGPLYKVKEYSVENTVSLKEVQNTWEAEGTGVPPGTRVTYTVESVDPAVYGAPTISVSGSGVVDDDPSTTGVSFLMPNGNVSLSITGGPELTLYVVNTPIVVPNGVSLYRNSNALTAEEGGVSAGTSIVYIVSETNPSLGYDPPTITVKVNGTDVANSSETPGQYDFDMPEGNVTVTVTRGANYSKEVKIGDITWARTNLATNNTFATNPYDYGAYFQFGSATPHTYTGGGTTTSSSWSYTQNWAMGDGPDFADVANPCPPGWRLPTEGEYTAMVAAAVNSGAGNALVTMHGSNNPGRRYTFYTFVGDLSLFFPAGGYRLPDYSSDQGSVGRYWTGSYPGGYGRSFDFLGTKFGGLDIRVVSTAQPIRCVKPDLYKVTGVTVPSGVTLTRNTTATSAGNTGVPAGTIVTFTASETNSSSGYDLPTVTAATASGAVTDTDAACNVLTFAMPAVPVTVTVTRGSDYNTPVTINGVTWAAQNLMGNATFAPYGYVYGALFQFGSNTVYNYSGGTTPSTTKANVDWALGTHPNYTGAANPCPSGWRLPTRYEFNDMIASATNSAAGAALVTIPGSSNPGRRFDFGPGKSLFFPVGGHRNASTAADQGSVGYYWTSEFATSTLRTNTAYNVVFSASEFADVTAGDVLYASSVRCVKTAYVYSPAGEVRVGGIAWSASNLTAADKFSKSESDYGAYFQFGSPTAYDYSGGTNPPTWNYTQSWPMGSAPDFAAAENPCPTGWRLPSNSEYTSMRNTSTNSGVTALEGRFQGAGGTTIYGRSLEFADGKRLFFSASGSRTQGNSSGADRTTNGRYWTREYNGMPIDMNFNASVFLATSSSSASNAYSVRCVRPL